MRPIRLHNTLTGTVEDFVPEKPPEVRLYVCGLTVYGRGHIGNFRTFLAVDILRRTLEYKGYRVQEVMNITDVDDKIIQLATPAGKDLPTFTAPHIAAFEEDMRAAAGDAGARAAGHRARRRNGRAHLSADRARAHVHGG